LARYDIQYDVSGCGDVQQSTPHLTTVAGEPYHFITQTDISSTMDTINFKIKPSSLTQAVNDRIRLCKINITSALNIVDAWATNLGLSTGVLSSIYKGSVTSQVTIALWLTDKPAQPFLGLLLMTMAKVLSKQTLSAQRKIQSFQPQPQPTPKVPRHHHDFPHLHHPRRSHPVQLHDGCWRW
jgi:hypothetical protein